MPTAGIRRAVEADAPALLALRQALFAETEFLLWEPGEFKDSVEDERARIVRLSGRPNSLCLVAESNAQLVGFLNAMGGQVNRQRHSTTLALAVLRAHWGAGIAGALLAEVLAWSRQVGLSRVELTVHTTNFRAVALYLRAGFQVEGVRRRSLLVSGRYVDEYLMSVVHEA